MRRGFFQNLLFLLVTCIALQATDYKLVDGTVLSGERVVSASDAGVVLALADGNISNRTAWNKFSQEALKKFDAEFVTNTRVTAQTKFLIKSLIRVEPLPNPGATNEMELPLPVVPEVIKAPRPPLTKVEGFERPLADPSFFAAMSSSIGVLAVLIVLAANFFAAFEIAIYKHRPLALVMGVSVVPIIGPLVFLCMPAAKEGSSKSVPTAEEPLREVGGQKQAVATAAPENPDSVFYRPGEVTINKRFIETKLTGFMKMVPTGDYKNLWLAVRTADGEFWTQNITKISQESMTVKTPVENVWDHREVSYFQIQELEIRRWVAEET